MTPVIALYAKTRNLHPYTGPQFSQSTLSNNAPLTDRYQSFQGFHHVSCLGRSHILGERRVATC